MINKVRVGLIGYGLAGKVFHSPLIQNHSGYEILSVYTSKTDEVKLQMPNVEVVQNIDKIIRNPEIDLVINCAPNEFHYEYTFEALKNNKHVVVEKPFVNNIAEGEALIKLAKEQDKILSVFHNRRWDGDFLSVKKLIDSGSLGEIKQFESHMDRWRPEVRNRWKERAGVGSGLLYDLGVHLIDQVLCLFGLPEKIMGDVECQRMNAQTDDYFHLILIYKKMRVILHASSFCSQSPRFQVYGDKFSFVKFGVDPQEEQLKMGLSPKDPRYGIEEGMEKGNYPYFYDQLYQALIYKKEVPVKPEQALKAIKLIELAKESSDKKTWLDITDYIK